MKSNPRCLLVSFLLALPAASHASSASLRKELQSDYDKISAAEKSLDYTTFAQTVTSVSEPSCTWIAQNGRAIDLTAYLALRKKALTEIKSITTDNYTVLTVKDGGDTASARVHTLITGTESDRANTYGLPGGRHAVTMDRLYDTAWVKYSTGWRLHSVTVVSSTLIVDGKVIVPPTPTVPVATARRTSRSSRRRY